MALRMSRNKPSRRGQRSERVGVVGGIAVRPDERKFERETADITRRIRELESKMKRPVSSNATQLILAEIKKENGVLAELEKAKEAAAVEMRATDTKIREIGGKYKDKKMVANDLLAGVRHKTDGRHDDAVERLEQQILIRSCSNTEERKFRQEIDALKKSKERLAEYSAAKSEVDELREEQETLRSQRLVLHKKTKELRVKELATKDVIVSLKQELEEARERKKVGISEKDALIKEIEELHKERKQLHYRFQAEQLAFSEQLIQQSEVERQRRDQHRDQHRAAWEARRKSNRYRDVSLSFQREQHYLERVATCKALISHLNKLTITSTGPATPDLDEDSSSPVGSATNLDPSPPHRSESDPTDMQILRREKEEVLVPAKVMLTRKRSKKEKKRNMPVVKRLNLNHTTFSQFATLDLAPPNTSSDIPQVLSHLQDKLTYLQGMSKSDGSYMLEMELADSGVVSTTPSEFNEPIDRDTDFGSADFANSQEDDPGFVQMISPKRSHSDIVGNGGVAYSKLLSSTSVADVSVMNHVIPTTTTNDLCSVSDESLLCVDKSAVLPPPNLVSMTSSSTASASGNSIAVTGSEE